jgi:hypothetical protein
MAVQANLTINDGQGTPAAVTFNAMGVKGPIATYRDMSTTIAIGRREITLSLTETKSTTKVETRILVPVMEVISGSDGGYTPAPKVAYSLLSKCEDIIPNRATQAQRSDLRAFRWNLSNHAVYTSAVKDLEPVW